MPGLTIHDIAREAGVGKSTVSRVINGTGYISPETRKKVQDVMQRYNYVPSSAARSLSRQQSDTIGIILPESNNPFFAEILLGVCQMVDAYGLTLILCGSGNNVDKDIHALGVMLRQRVKGLIYTPAVDYSSQQEFERIHDLIKQLRCPTVLLDRPIFHLQSDGVFSDNFRSAYLATEALIKAGHRKIGTIAGDLELSIGRERYHGYQKALEAYGIIEQKEYFVPGKFDSALTYELMCGMLDAGDLPTAFFISNNLSAYGFLQAISERGLRIPEDIAFIGFDRMYGQDVFGLPYSYVEREVMDMGKRAMELLINRFENPRRPFEKVIMEPTLKLLGSERLLEKRPQSVREG
ncbi:MAG: LacI family DNA-binding transcriptional regulator [Candidatus Limiplasma sp.]|nr:LacI family DNA-binding transcriptional regulator [Candidatus Limiplasma sp.]